MNSKERAYAAFRGQRPDRPPLGFFAIDSDTAGQLLGHGGCILGTSHSVAVGTRYENFMTLLDQYTKWL